MIANSDRRPNVGNAGRTGRKAGPLLAAGVFAGLLASLLGCSKQPSATTETAKGSSSAQPAASAAVAEKHYAFKGEIISVVPERKALLVHHEEIPGYMPSMTMEFTVSPGDLAVAKAGQKIRADLIVGANDAMRLEKIWPDSNTDTAAVAAGAQALRQDTLIRGKNAYREVGEIAPDFTLYDQNGHAVQFSRFRGKMVMVNFIYTRCPIATMCPAATAKMMATQKMAKEAGVTKIEFVSITLDAAYDTPGVLREYAEARGIDTSNFSFLTGPDNAIKDLLEQFGVIAEFDGNILKHSLATLLIDGNGKIIHRADGSPWEPQDFVAKMSR
jgi:protein SCO1/2